MKLAAAERDEFFAQLTLLHAAVSRAGLQAGRGAEGPTTRLGRDADREFSEADLAALEADSVPMPGPATLGEAQDIGRIDELRVGDSVCFHGEGQDRVLALQWVSPMGGMFLFAAADGYDAISLTRARLIDKLGRGEARLAI
jgi:hypothetical protein